MQEISRSYITIAAFSLKKPFKIPNKTRYSYTGQKAFQRIVHIYLHKKILLPAEARWGGGGEFEGRGNTSRAGSDRMAAP